jgi:hypothetical protein
MFRQRRSMFFKKMQIVRGCDAKRNVLVYMVYSDKLIDGSPKNSTSSVPIMPWAPVPRSKSAATSFSSHDFRIGKTTSPSLARLALALGRIFRLMWPGLLAAAHQMKQSLWGRLIAAVAPLLRHRATIIRACCPCRGLLIDPRFG